MRQSDADKCAPTLRLLKKLYIFMETFLIKFTQDPQIKVVFELTYQYI